MTLHKVKVPIDGEAATGARQVTPTAGSPTGECFTTVAAEQPSGTWTLSVREAAGTWTDYPDPTTHNDQCPDVEREPF